MDETDVIFRRLHRAGWLIGDAVHTVSGQVIWIVIGSNGENLIMAEGPTRDAAWIAAAGQARERGMAGYVVGPAAAERDLGGTTRPLETRPRVKARTTTPRNGRSFARPVTLA